MISGFAKLLDLITGAWDSLKPYAAVYAWEKGGLTRWGRYHKTLGPGFYFKWPCAEKTHKVITAVSTMRGPTQTVGARSFRWTAKYQVTDVELYTVAIYEEENFLRDVCTGQVAECLVNEADKWENMMQRLRTEASEGGFRILKMRLVDDTKVRALRLFGDGEHAA